LNEGRLSLGPSPPRNGRGGGSPWRGLVIWDSYFYQYTSIRRRIAVLVHSIAVILAIFVRVVHVYAAMWVPWYDSEQMDAKRMATPAE